MNGTTLDFGSIVRNFKFEGDFLYAERYGDGHINDTYAAYFKLENGRSHRYILQRINNRLFTDVPRLMNNIRLVTEFNRAKISERGGNPDRESLTLIPTTADMCYYFDGQNYFRAYIFIEQATTYQVVEDPKHFYESAVAFGNFQQLLAKFDASQLFEVLPGFHDTKLRFANFMRTLKADPMKRAALVQAEVDFVIERERYCSRFTDLIDSGKMPVKVTHNDTKLNNVMIDDATGKAATVIDLDTIMPGAVGYDFGDAIRFGCNPAAEDERDLSLVNFRLDLFQTYAEGYLAALKGTLTSIELETLAFSAILMTYECGMRFLTDYLDGDNYFRTHRPGQNLDRARTQFKLVSDMESLLPKMDAIIARLS